MNPSITFFYNQRKTPNVTEQLLVATAKLEAVVYIYSKSSLRPKNAELLDQDTFDTDEEYTLFYKTIENAVAQAGGGVIIEEVRSRPEIPLRISRVYSDQSDQPTEAVLLRPGYRAKPVVIDDHLQLETGCHLIVPVDQSSQHRLKNLKKELGWISHDMESLVLNMISQPGLDSRLDRIERRIDALTADKGIVLRQIEFGNWKDRLKYWARISWGGLQRYASAITLVLLLILLVNSMVFDYGTGEMPNPSPPPPSPSPSPPPPNPPPPNPPPPNPSPSPPPPSPPPPAPIDVQATLALQDLQDTLKGLPEQNPARILYESHFKGHAVDSMVDLNGNETFGWGFVKLLAIKMNRDVKDSQGVSYMSAVIAKAEQRSAARVLFRDMIPDLPPEDLPMLALVTCISFTENREMNKAGLPSDPRDPTEDWYYQRVELQVECDRVNAPVALSGLQALSDHFKGEQSGSAGE